MRRPGGGRKRLRELDPGLEAALDALVDPDSRGDPMSPLRWTCKRTGQLALALTYGGHPVSADVVGNMLREAGYSLQANVKVREGNQHEDRDAQFRYLNEQAREFRDAGLPVVSRFYLAGVAVAHSARLPLDLCEAGHHRGTDSWRLHR